jgi:fructokinase
VKEDWERISPFKELTLSDLTLYFPNFNFSTAVISRISHGLSSSNYLIQSSQKYVARFPTGNIEQEIKIVSMLSGYLPVPSIVGENLSERCYLMEYIDGVPASDFIKTATSQLKIKIYRAAGRILAKIHSFNFEDAGFFDSRLEVVRPLLLEAEFLKSELLTELAIERINQVGPHFLEQLWNIIQENQSMLNVKVPTLVHGDYNFENLLVNGEGEISAVLDWEFAFSHSPYFDLGNFLRYESDLKSHLVESFIASYYEGRSELIDREWKKRVRVFDLITLLSFLIREKLGETQLTDILQKLVEYVIELDGAL